MSNIYGPLWKMVEIDIAHARLQEAKRALTRICHSMNCPGMGTEIGPGEPESCWQGDESEPCCLRIYQWRRIHFLQGRLHRLWKHAKTRIRRRA